MEAITTTEYSDLQQSESSRPTAKSRIGLIVAASMAAGLVLAVVLVAIPLIPATENVLTGVVLLAWALGWALLAVLSVRFSDQPQRWAAAPAAFMALVGLGVLGGSGAVHRVLSWVWPAALFVLVIWMFLRARRQLRSRTARWLLYPVLVALAIASLGGGYATVRESLDAPAYRMPGQLVDVGGHRLHLHCIGSGSPTVVLEPGLGATSSDLGWITPTVARDSRVCVYDRAGRGWSDPADGRQDGAHIAADLRTLLDRAHVPGPYVLAGHSFGGLYVLSFAAQFPDQVAGMVLLDSTAPKAGPAPPTNTRSYSFVRRVAAVLPAVAHLGAGRSLGSFVEEFLQGSASVHQASSLTDLSGKPLIVLTADTGHDAKWQSAQDHLATLSTNSVHRVAKATTHQSLIDDEADSAAASAAIHDVVASVRTSQPIASR